MERDDGQRKEPWFDGRTYVIKLVICDDSIEARRLVRTLLSEHPEIEIVGEAEDGETAVELALEHEPDVVLMDIVMPGLDGIEATRRIRSRLPETRVVAFTGVDDQAAVQGILEAGADSFVVKGSPLWELERAIQGASQPLLRLAHTLARTTGERSSTSFVVRETCELTGAVLAAIFLVQGEELLPAGVGGPSLDAGERATPRDVPRIARRAYEELRLCTATGCELIELYRLYGVPCGSATAVPLAANGSGLGVLLVLMPANVQFELDADLVSALADLAAGDLAGKRQLATSRAEARRDPLTELRNRRAFEEHLRELLERTQGEEPVSLVLLDVDEFKQVNDSAGHPTGDRVLVAIAHLLESHARAAEDVFRIGGDEFALVVLGDAAAAAGAAQRLREAVASHEGPDELPSLSAGVATVPDHARDADQLLRRADEALYASKDAGRNRVVVYAPAGETGQVESIGAVASRRAEAAPSLTPAPRTGGIRILVVDDHPNLRMLLRTTFEIIDVEVDEAGDAAEAWRRIRARRPDVIVLDVALPDVDGVTLCKRLRAQQVTAEVPIVLLTGAAGVSEDEGRAAGANAFVRKPFSPLELLETIEQLAGLPRGPFRLMAEERPEEQLMLYAQDLRRLLEIERSQRLLIQSAYEETVGALARALDSKDIGTGTHSMRVAKYAGRLAEVVDTTLLEDPSVHYGFLLHDIGKIGIPDSLLGKRGPLSNTERRVIETHTILGEQILGRVPLLQGEGLRIIRSHHERWDGSGYPDHLQGDAIPVGARVFAVADALDAMTTDRPYREAGTWHEAVQEIVSEAGHHFDPSVVEAFQSCEPQLRRIYFELGAA